MERTIIASEFKGGVWHRFFSATTKKDETLVSILDEKIRYYKLYYPFLEKKQIVGKAYEELDIPHICGEVNRKELHKLFLKERKNNCKLKEKYKKYPTLFIENKCRNNGTFKKPTIPTTKQIKVNSVHTNDEKSKEDHAFDNLLSNVNSHRQEGMIQNMNLKQTKSVRFNDGIEVHSVSPSLPLYKLKPLGRLFDEPSAVRAVEKLSYFQQELQERIDDSDSDFDADTGVTSDIEDDDLEDPPLMEDFSKRTEITENEKVEEKSLLDTKTKTVYDCSEDDSQSMDHEIRKEGNDLILSSRMITVVQGKWVRETKEIIGNTYHTKDTIMSNSKSVKEDTDDVREELAMVRNIEYILENIKSLCISNTEHNTSSDAISSIDRSENELNMKVEKEQLMVGSIKVGQDLTDIEITIQDKNEHKHITKVCSKNITSKISLEKDLSTHLIDEKLLTIDSNKLSYEHDIFEMKSNMDENIEKRIRTKPIKLVDDLIDYINDWNSSNEGSLNYNANQTLSSKPMHASDPERDKHMKTKEVMEDKTVMDDEGSSECSLIEEESCLDKVEDNLEDLSLEEKCCLDKDEDDLSLEEKRLDKEEENLKYLSLEEKSCLNERNDSPLLPANNNQQVSSQLFESNRSLNTTSQSLEIIKTESSSLSDKSRSTKEGKIGYETHDYLQNIDMIKRNELLGEKEFQINDAFTFIRSIECNQSTSNPNELYSTFCSLITKPILVQSQYVEEEGDDKINYNQLKSFEAEKLDKENKKMQSGYSVSEHKLKRKYNEDIKTQGMAKGDNEIHEDENIRPSEENTENNLEENTKIKVRPKLLKKSVITMTSIDHSNSSLAGQQKDNESGDNTSKIFITDKKLFCVEPENILDDMETTEKNEGHIAIDSKASSTNFLSKVQMWSLHSKNYSGNLTTASQTSSVLASCNTDSLRNKIVDMEESLKNNDESYYSNLSNEDSLTSRSNEEYNISEGFNSSGMDLETASSATPGTPIKMGENNSEEISTAYETDPETGKLVMNRYLHPITYSTPIKLPQIHEQENSVSKRGPNDNSLRESSTHSFHYVKENKGNQGIELETKNNSTNEIVSSELSSHVRLLATFDKKNETETNDVLHIHKIDIKNNKKSALNDFTVSPIEKHSEVFSGIDKPVLQQSNSESIIENSETDSHRTFKIEEHCDIVKPIISHPICTDKQQDTFAIGRYTLRTEINPMEISIKSKIEKCNTFTISETTDSCTEKHIISEATYGSSIPTNELYTSKKKVTLNFKAIDKTSADSHCSDIIYDTSNITEDYELVQYTKTSTVGVASIKEGEHRILESEKLINENELNISESIITGNKKRLSAISESIINHNSKIHDKVSSGKSEKVHSSNKICNPNQLGTVTSHSPIADENSSLNSTYNDLKNEDEKTDLSLGMHDPFPKKIVKNRNVNVSHVTFLIRDPKAAEDSSSITEFGYQQQMNLSQLDNTPKIKQGDQNKEPNTNEILLTATKLHSEQDRHDNHLNETLKVPSSNLLALDNNGSHFSIGVENSHIESSLLSSNNDKHKYFTRTKTYSGLKRKLRTIDENDSGSDISLSQDELSRKEIKMNNSSSIHSTGARYSESPVTTETSSIEMNLKRVNTDIRRKRAKLKKENPVRKSSTSSSEGEIKKPSLLKGKVLETSKSPVHKFTESNIKVKQSNKFDVEGTIDIVDKRTQQNTRSSYTNPKDDGPRNFSSLSLSFENEPRNERFDDKASNRPKETQYKHLSDSSSSIIYSSPTAKTGKQNKITKTYDKSKIYFDNKIKKRQLEEESQYFSGVSSAKKRSEKSHKSYALYRKNDDSNKENPNIPLEDSRPGIKYAKKPLRQSNPGKSDTVLDVGKDQDNETKNPHQSIKKNRKSSIVRLMGTAEASQISNSPEVKGLLRRTYFMGNH